MNLFPVVFGALIQRTVLSLSTAVGIAGNTAALAAESVADDQLRADCRTEGRAASIQGEELERFVRECIAEFLEVELINVEE